MNLHCWGHPLENTLQCNNMNLHCWGHPPDCTLQDKVVNPHYCGHSLENTLQGNSMNLHCCGHPLENTLQGSIVKPHCCGHSPSCTLKATMRTHTLQHCEPTPLWTPSTPHSKGNIVKTQQCGFTILPYSLWLATAAPWSRRCLSWLTSYALVLYSVVQLNHIELWNLSISYGEDSGLLICGDVSLVRDSPTLRQTLVPLLAQSRSTATMNIKCPKT